MFKSIAGPLHATASSAAKAPNSGGRTIRRTLFTFAAVLAIAGCATQAGLSYVSGHPLTRTDRDLFPLRLVSLDGQVNVAGHPELPMEAGIHSLVVAYGREQRTYAFKAEGCMRYYIGARVNPMDSKDWKLELGEREQIPGCAVGSRIGS